MPHARTIALCAAALIVALLIVGYVSNGIARHVVQTAPAWLVVIAGLSGARATKWLALPVFAAWLAIMLFIWLYLLGISHVLTGAFSPVEIAMTIVVGVACVFGIFLALGSRSGMPLAAGLFVLAIATALQAGALWQSMQPRFANDTDFKAWISAKTEPSSTPAPAP